MNHFLPPFQAPKLKLRWGEAHVERLGLAIDEFVASRPFELHRVDPPGHETGGYNIVLKSPMPAVIPLLLGDAVHNLRTSLDLLACDLVRLNKNSTKGVYFPFSANKDGLADQIKNKKFDRAGPEAVELLKKIAPYEEANPTLRAVHDLDVTDKHKLLVPVIQRSVVKELVLTHPEGGQTVMQDCQFHNNFIDIPCGPEWSVEVSDIQCVALFMYSDELPALVRAKPLFDTLATLAQDVRGTIEAFEALFVRNGG